jgi:hypothetical protein
MPRASAILLLALFGFLLISPAVVADANSNLPACCRKDGKHHCSMTSPDESEESGGALQSVRSKCPMFPGSAAAPAHSSAAAARPTDLFFASLVGHPAAHAQTDAPYRVSFSRSLHKRGPPSIS